MGSMLLNPLRDASQQRGQPLPGYPICLCCSLVPFNSSALLSARPPAPWDSANSSSSSEPPLVDGDGAGSGLGPSFS
eukprot:COSAG04_NODE_3405_length_2844_cov_3.814208_3_plen_77_part_00